MMAKIVCSREDLLWFRGPHRRQRFRVPHHVYMRNPGFEKLLADHAEPQALVERCGMDLGRQHLLAQIAVLRLDDCCLHQRIADFKAAPVLEDRHPANLAILQQAGGADGVVIFHGQEVDGVVVVRIPFQFRRNVLLGDEHGFANPADISVVLVDRKSVV